jgi:hypothetical protein|tara:strand:+ start:64 stop:306 length:243 start_codon:yes stop_codon:yes gene_type:complete
MNTYSNLTNEQRNEIDKAVKLVNIKDIRELNFGEDLELTEEVCLSHYCEDEVIVLNLTNEWIEVFQIQNYKDEEVIFETL